MTYLVYKHTSPSGKSYIGQTCDYDYRCWRHQQSSSKCKAFAAAIKKYGWDNFTHEILYDGLTQEQANFREQQAINEYGTVAPCGYNLTTGGDSWERLPSTRAKLSEAGKGRKRSEETKAKIRATMAARAQTREGQEAMARARAAIGDRAPLADDTKARISASVKATLQKKKAT